jgi:hypothetical protein
VRHQQYIASTKFARYILAAGITILLPVLAAMGFHVEEAHAEPNITVKKVFEQSLNGGVYSFATNGDIYLYSGGIYLMSDDGIHWAKKNLEIKVDDEIVHDTLEDILWDGKQFISYFSDKIVTSTDGVKWTGTQIQLTDSMYGKVNIIDMIWDSQKYIALTQPTGPGSMPHDFYYSYDLNTWHKGTRQWTFNTIFTANTLQIKNMASNGSDIYLASGEQQVYSEDGIHWEGNLYRSEDEVGIGKRNQSGDNGQNYIWDGSKFWLASGSVIKSSSDGVDWNIALSIDNGTINLDSIGYNGRAYLATGPTNNGYFQFYYSVDGDHWEKVERADEGGAHIQLVQPVKGGFLLASQDIYWIGDNEWNTPSSWAAEAIKLAEQNKLVNKELLRAYPSPITRSEFSKTAVRIYEALTAQRALPPVTNPFVDTARPDVLKAYDLGIVKGDEGGLFKPDDPMTRQDLAVMLYRTLQAADVSLAPSKSWQQTYADIKEVASYAEEPLRYFNAVGIVGGKDQNRLAPRDYTSRQEALVLAQRIFDTFDTGKTFDPGPTTGFESVKGLLEEQGYIVLEQDETSIGRAPIVQSYIVQDQDSNLFLSYNKVDSGYEYSGELFRKIHIYRYNVGSDDHLLELARQIIEREKGVSLPEVSEFLKNTAIEAQTRSVTDTFMFAEEYPDIVVNFVSYRQENNGLAIQINY